MYRRLQVACDLGSTFLVTSDLQSAVNKNKTDTLLWLGKTSYKIQQKQQQQNNNKNLHCHKDTYAGDQEWWRSRMAKREREEEFEVSEVAPLQPLSR